MLKIWPPLLLAALIAFGAHAQPPAGRVSIDRSSFNPSLGESVSITVSTPARARISVAVLDRDGYITRWLAQDEPAGGTYTARWDGRDTDGAVVADEAYSFKVDVTSADGRWTYCPAAQTPKTYAVPARQYSRRSAALMYDLPAPARVHAQTGSATLDEKTKAYNGPVLKTVVNREPRPGGAVVESWNGLDESGAIYVPDLPNFVTAILATELPENAVIAFGNRSRSFLDAASARTGETVLPRNDAATHAHHHGLEALEDVSPGLAITPMDARWDERTRTWTVAGGVLRLNVALTGPTAPQVARHPGRVVVFVDYVQVLERELGTSTGTIEVPLAGGPAPRVVSVNWQSTYGPLAANSLRVVASAAQGVARRSR